MIKSPQSMEIIFWSIDRFVFYARNPRKNDAAVDRMCASIREFGFKIPCLARSDGTLVDGHLRIKAARKLGSWPGGDVTAIPVILCDEWTEAQVKAFRLMVNRSVTWADWDEDLLALELQELSAADFDLSLTGFDPKEIDDLLLVQDDDDRANAAPPLPEIPVSRLGDLWTCGKHSVLCADATSPDAVARLLGDRKPQLMVTDPPYGIELDSEWRDRAGLNSCGPAEASYMKHRTTGHTETTISGDTRADWSEAFELVPSLQIAYVWHASVFTREVLNGLLRIGFLYPQQIIWNKGRTVRSSASFTRVPYSPRLFAASKADTAMVPRTAAPVATAIPKGPSAVSTEETAPFAPWSGFSMNWLTRSPNPLMASDCFSSASSASLAALTARDSRAAFSSIAIIFS